MHTPFIVNNKPFFVLGGQVHNSSGYGPESMETAWKALAALNANTAEVPVYWEQVEPVEGEFHFDHLDGIIEGARQRGLRLVLLWFATWKNGSMQYAPEWVKTNPQRFPRVITPSGRPLWVLSSHHEATWEADRKAYCRLLEHLRDFDSEQKTVISVQIENEPGILGSVRDCSPAANQQFEAPVPADLITALPDFQAGPVRTAWERSGQPNAGTWAQVFGEDAAEYFTTWSIARYIDRLAQAGKAVYDLPMYANVWLGENGWYQPGVNYPSGGPVSTVLDLWKWAAPHLDLLAPDIYIQQADLYNSICRSYRRADNPLFVPESGGSLSNALNMFEAIATYRAIGYAVFGIESLLEADGTVRESARPLVESFRCTAAVLPLLERSLDGGQIHAIIQREFMGEQHLDFGDYLAIAKFSTQDNFTDFRHWGSGADERGRGLIFTPNPREFYLTGAGFRLLLKKKLPDHLEFSRANDQFETPMMNYLRVEEGHFTPQGDWVVDRYRNGDEVTSGLWVAPDVGVVHAVLAD